MVIRSPKPGETYLGLLKEAWPRLSPASKISNITERIPELSAELTGWGKWYWKSVRTFGFLTWWAPHNLYRQVWHFIGGFLAALLHCWLGLGWLAIPTVATYTILKEVKEAPAGGMTMKGILDMLSWMSGAVAGVILCL